MCAFFFSRCLWNFLNLHYIQNSGSSDIVQCWHFKSEETLESVRIGKCQNAFFFKIGRCQNRKVSEFESVRIWKCQNLKVSELESLRNWKVSKLESVRIGKCHSWNLSEMESVRNIWSFKMPYNWAKYCLSSNLSIHYLSVEVSYVMVCITMVTQASFGLYLNYLKIMTISHSDTFQFWHFPILTLSDSDTFQFWHFQALTLSNFVQNGQKLDCNTFQFWHFPIPHSQQILTLSIMSSFWQFPISAVFDTFQSKQFLWLSNSDTFLYEVSNNLNTQVSKSQKQDV